jgi:hypothetical protein
MPPVRRYRCLSCDSETKVHGTMVSPGAVSFPTLFCINCNGNPELVVVETQHPGRVRRTGEAGQGRQ